MLVTLLLLDSFGGLPVFIRRDCDLFIVILTNLNVVNVLILFCSLNYYTFVYLFKTKQSTVLYFCFSGGNSLTHTYMMNNIKKKKYIIEYERRFIKNSLL